ncbi:Peptidoglycan/xylan/chitin deacetylase, PgdA/CDA1 family [Halobacillus dabanensis]|uniref:Peptidoglycan/xylan/chitin deacetylase, PgdA/CDA1 family n=1 Tax=Halobacillus dabanensis TaxID=240302 RepID=A0A1I3TDK6_HALDA|nr:polysaccharide deacetylase family protein [Halobacillus dabanensis]SFJ67746.1 Peptidoglycan/xylan/chitin deacetylase, PgdA/CDA1 family [Halobacillus dabanensis]
MKKKWLIGGIILVSTLLLLYGTYEWMNARSFQLFGGVTDRVETEKKIVALTFDDGPTENAQEILSLLEEYDVKTTFFVNGKDLEENMEIGKEINEAGHQLGNHTYSHEPMVFKRYSFYKEEVQKTNELIRRTGYEKKIDFRPPYGKKLAGLPYYLKEQGMDTIMWDIEPDTYHTSSTGKVSFVAENIQPGSIILFHPMYMEVESALSTIEGIIETLSEKGYTFVTVDELQKEEQDD